MEDAAYENVVYLCTNHGHANDPTWLADLLEPLKRPGVAMSGCLLWGNYEAVAGDDPQHAEMPWLHVQGGIWAAKRSVLKKHPYSYKYPQAYSDVRLCYDLAKSGYELADVPSIKSVGGGKLKHPERYKYVHDYR